MDPGEMVSLQRTKFDRMPNPPRPEANPTSKQRRILELTETRCPLHAVRWPRTWRIPEPPETRRPLALQTALATPSKLRILELTETFPSKSVRSPPGRNRRLPPLTRETQRKMKRIAMLRRGKDVQDRSVITFNALMAALAEENNMEQFEVDKKTLLDSIDIYGRTDSIAEGMTRDRCLGPTQCRRLRTFFAGIDTDGSKPHWRQLQKVLEHGLGQEQSDDSETEETPTSIKSKYRKVMSTATTTRARLTKTALRRGKSVIVKMILAKTSVGFVWRLGQNITRSAAQGLSTEHGRRKTPKISLKKMTSAEPLEAGALEQPEAPAVVETVAVESDIARPPVGPVAAEVNPSDFKSLEIDCTESAVTASTKAVTECDTPNDQLADCVEPDSWSDAASSHRFSSPNPSEHEDGSERKLKRRRIHMEPGTSAPKTPTGRLAYPLSERQQMQMLLQMTAGEGGTPGDSPRSPCSLSTPTSSKSTRGRTPRVHKRNEHGETPLHLAAIRGDYKLCRRLIKEGADVNSQDYAGWAPLHEACNHNSYESAKVLLVKGANVNLTGMEQDTPLHDAASSGNVQITILLLKHGADPDRTNQKGEKPADVAEDDFLRDLLTGKTSWTDRLDEYPSPPMSASPPTSDSEHEDHDDQDEKEAATSKEREDRDREEKLKQRKDKPQLEKRYSSEKKEHKQRHHTKVHGKTLAKDVKYQKIIQRRSAEGTPMDTKESRESRRISLDFTGLQDAPSGDESSNDGLRARKAYAQGVLPGPPPTGAERDDRDKERRERERKERREKEERREREEKKLQQASATAVSSSGLMEKSKLQRPREEGRPRAEQTAATAPTTPLSSVTKFKERERIPDKRDRDDEVKEREKSDKEKRHMSFKERIDDKKKRPFLSPQRPVDDKDQKRRRKDVYEFHSSDSDDGAPHAAPLKYSKNREGQSKAPMPPSSLAKEKPTTPVTPVEPKRKFLIDCPAALNIKSPMFPVRKSTDQLKRQSSTSSDAQSPASAPVKSIPNPFKMDAVPMQKQKERKSSVEKDKLSSSKFVSKGLKQGFADKELIRKQVLSGSMSPRAEETKKKDSKLSQPVMLNIPRADERKEVKKEKETTPLSSPKLEVKPEKEKLERQEKVEKRDEKEKEPLKVPPLRIVFPSSSRESTDAGPSSASTSGSTEKNQGKESVTNVPYVVTPSQTEDEDSLPGSSLKDVRLTRSKVKQTPTPPKELVMPIRKRKAQYEALSKEDRDDPAVVAERAAIDGYYDMKKQLMSRWNTNSKNDEIDFRRPPDFEKFMVNQKNYLIFDKLENSKSRAGSPPPNLHDRLKELYRSQETDRHNLRQRHQAENESLRLLCEKETMRVYARCSRAAAGHLQPALSFAQVLRDEDVYNPCVLDKKAPIDVEALERCSGDQFDAWLEEVSARFKKRKTEMLSRQRMEAQSMFAAQKMEFESRIRILKLTTSAILPDTVEPNHVPQVTVPDDVDLLPSQQVLAA